MEARSPRRLNRAGPAAPPQASEEGGRGWDGKEIRSPRGREGRAGPSVSLGLLLFFLPLSPCCRWRCCWSGRRMTGPRGHSGRCCCPPAAARCRRQRNSGLAGSSGGRCTRDRRVHYPGAPSCCLTAECWSAALALLPPAHQPAGKAFCQQLLPDTLPLPCCCCLQFAELFDSLERLALLRDIDLPQHARLAANTLLARLGRQQSPNAAAELLSGLGYWLPHPELPMLRCPAARDAFEPQLLDMAERIASRRGRQVVGQGPPPPFLFGGPTRRSGAALLSLLSFGSPPMHLGPANRLLPPPTHPASQIQSSPSPPSCC